MDTVRACIEAHADATPDGTFLIAPEGGQRLSYSELKTAVDEFGERLDALGLGPDAKVAFLANNGYWSTQIFLGVMANNRVIVPLNAVSGQVQLVHVLDHSDAEVVFVQPEYRDKLAEIMQQIERPIRVIEVTDESGPDWPERGLSPATASSE